MKHFHNIGKIAMALAVASTITTSIAQEEVKELENPDFGRWYISPGIGATKFEGDYPLEDGMFFTIRLGYDYSEWFRDEDPAPSLLK